MGENRCFASDFLFFVIRLFSLVLLFVSFSATIRNQKSIHTEYIEPHLAYIMRDQTLTHTHRHSTHTGGEREKRSSGKGHNNLYTTYNTIVHRIRTHSTHTHTRTLHIIIAPKKYKQRTDPNIGNVYRTMMWLSFGCNVYHATYSYFTTTGTHTIAHAQCTCWRGRWTRNKKSISVLCHLLCMCACAWKGQP